MPPRTLRRRTRSGTQLVMDDNPKKTKRGRSEKADIVSIAALPVPERPSPIGNGVWVNDRYMRRKNREYFHAIQAAQAIIEAEQTPDKQQLLLQETLGVDDKEMLVPGDREEEERGEGNGDGDGNECGLEVKKSLAQEEQGEERENEMESLINLEERSVRSACPEKVTMEEEATFEEKELIVSKSAADTKGKSVVFGSQSLKLIVHSPVKAIESKVRQGSGIDPTPEKSAAPGTFASKPKKNVARGIAQSSSSASTRKRMISFSPERAPRPENRALALKKLERNLKTNEKLEQRLKAPTPVKARAPAQMSSPLTALQTRGPISFTSPQARRPMTFTSPQTRRTMPFTSPPHQNPGFQSPHTKASVSLPLSQTEDLVYDPTQEVTKDSSSIKSEHADSGTKTSILVDEAYVVADQDADVHVHSTQEDERNALQSQDETGLSQESVSNVQSHVDHLTPSSQESGRMLHHTEETATSSDTLCNAFTSTSVIGDVGLFNCEADVEYTGGVYGEGTDGKVTAAVINGQKIALKRAKPHEGLPEHEAKHRAALELYYLRRVRHIKGFLQCLGLCDAIEHTCIALEVMDCKLSDYLRRYGVNSGGTKHRRYTLSFDHTKAMLKQICLPMITLHEEINVAHGDLACRNILMRTPPEGYEQSWEPDIKLSDFGRIKLPSDEPKILDTSFSFHKNCDVGAFGREILYRLLVGEIVPKECIETRSLHKLLQDVTVTHVSDAAKARLGPYYNLFLRCTAWGVRPTFREIYEHLNDLEYFETTENGLFPLKPTGHSDATFMSPVAEASRHKTPTSSASRARKRDTPTFHTHHPAKSKPRLFASKSFTEASVAGSTKPVNWLKTRSVGIQRTTAQQALTPTAHSLLVKKKKTPPSTSVGAGASRRSLQILNQIQHRTTEKARKSN